MVAASTCRPSPVAWSMYRSLASSARFSLGWTAFSALLPAPGGRTEERGGRGASTEHRRPKGPAPGGGGFCFVGGPPTGTASASTGDRAEPPGATGHVAAASAG